VPEAVVEAGAAVDHDLVLGGGVAEAEGDVERGLEEVHEDVAGVLVGSVFGEAVVVEAALQVGKKHVSFGDFE